MPRTIIDIPNEQLLEADRICKVLNISRAEAVRRALQEFVRQNQDIQQEGFGLWSASGIPRTELIDSLRRQW